jgi:phage gp36-like protein
MPQYATQADLALYGLTAAALGSFSPTEQDAALTAASSMADGYMGGRFNLPLTSWGQDLRLHVSKMAAWLLMSRRGFKPGVTDAESLYQGYKDAVAWLRDISTGKVTPFEGQGGIADEDGTGGSEELEAESAPFVVSPNASGPVYSDRLGTFLGHDPAIAPGTVGSPKPRGWNG